MRLQSEVPGIDYVILEIFQVPFVGLSTCWWKDLVVLSPDNQSWWLIVAKVFLPGGIQRRIRALALKHLQLNVLIAFAIQ